MDKNNLSVVVKRFLDLLISNWAYRDSYIFPDCFLDKIYEIDKIGFSYVSLEDSLTKNINCDFNEVSLLTIKFDKIYKLSINLINLVEKNKKIRMYVCDIYSNNLYEISFSWCYNIYLHRSPKRKLNSHFEHMCFNFTQNIYHNQINQTNQTNYEINKDFITSYLRINEVLENNSLITQTCQVTYPYLTS